MNKALLDKMAKEWTIKELPKCSGCGKSLGGIWDGISGELFGLCVGCLNKVEKWKKK